MSIAEKLTTVAQNQQRVYDAGKKAEYDRFWDGYQAGGARKNYKNAFAGAGWTVETFKPKHDMSPSAGYMMFADSQIAGDLVEIMDGLGVTLDLTKLDTLTYMFQNSRFTRVGPVRVSGPSAVTAMFDGCSDLVTIDRFIMDNANRYSSTFNGCTALANITIDGVIGQSGWTFSACPLTYDSLMSILGALEAKESGAYTLTLGAENLAKLTDAEKAMATQKGWTLA